MKLFNSARSIFLKLILVGLVIGLQACGGGSSSDTPTTTPVTTDQDGSGIYSGTAMVDVNTNITDLRGMVYNNRFMFFSETANPHVLYDGTVTSVSLDDYTATVDVYENGVKTQTAVAVTGKVLTANSITGTIGVAGNAGNHNGTFSLTYDSVYERGATVERIVATGFNEAIGTTYGTLNLSGNYTFNTNNDFIVLSTGASTCTIIDAYEIPNSNVNIYTLDDITIITDDSCLDSYEGTGYSGIASLVDDSVDGIDSRIIIAYTNGTNSVFGFLTKP